MLLSFCSWLVLTFVAGGHCTIIATTSLKIKVPRDKLMILKILLSLVDSHLSHVDAVDLSPLVVTESVLSLHQSIQ